MSANTVSGGPGTLAPGWYGKIPALGDFASRRLPPDFIAPWDSWLQGALNAARAALGKRWPRAYLASPPWRFLLLPGACGPGCWAGVLAPSMDKVGRHFPLTVAAALDAEPGAAAGVFAAHDWFRAIEGAASASLEPGMALDALEQALAAAPYPAPRAPACPWPLAARELGLWWARPQAMPAMLRLPDALAVPALVEGAAPHALAIAGRGRSLWWTGGERAGGAAFVACCGLPPHDSVPMAPAPGGPEAP